MQFRKGSYRIPDGVTTGERFVVKVQGNSKDIMVYDESRTCQLYITPEQPAFEKVYIEMKKEKAWNGAKTFMKASFDESGIFTIYPASAGVKSKYSW